VTHASEKAYAFSSYRKRLDSFTPVSAKAYAFASSSSSASGKVEEEAKA
jgi:hypothetical protein